MSLSDKRETWCLLAQDHAQEGIVDVDLAVVLDESEFPEFVHEKIDPGPRCANHLRQRLLRHFGKHFLRLASRAIVRKQQQGARQSFLAGVEKVVDQVLLDSYVSRQHIRNEAVGESMFSMEHACHLAFLNEEHGGRRNRGRASHANGPARKAPFSKKIPGSKDRYNGFLAGLVNNGELYTAFLNVHHTRSRITLRVDLL